MKENTFHKSKMIGNIAENIVEYMINSMPNWKCIRFGVENHIEDIKKAVRKKITNETRKIKSMPDFIAFNTKTEEILFIEVKYRSFINKQEGKSEYKIDFLTEYLDYWRETKLIVICPRVPPHFFVIDLKDVTPDMCRKEQVGQNEWDYSWEFKNIEKEIKEIFPELSDEILEEAIKMIPS